MRYVSADEVSEAQEAYRNNVSLPRIAGHLRVTVDELPKLLNLPSRPAQQQSDELDLWAADKLQEVL
jgi:hypothetical protein